MFRSKGKGWHGDSRKHSQASKKGWDGRRFEKTLASATGGKGGLSIQRGVSPDYYRPTSKLIGVDKIDEFKEGLEKDGFKKISRYAMANIQKRTGSPTKYELGVLNTKDRMFYDNIIVDRKGNIPELQGILRMIDVESGGDRGKRNVLVDLGVTANKVYAQDEKGNWKWYMNPNKSDIEHIDTDYSQYAKTYDKIKDSKQFKAGKGIVLMARTPKEEKDMRGRIDKAFTKKEQKEMGLVFISVTNTPRGIAGRYYPDANPKQVQVDPDFADTSDVLIHELVHHHRNVAKDRTGALKHIKRWEGRDKDLEESTTEAETLAREKPFDKSKAGYYPSLTHVKGVEKTRAEFKDRKLFSGYDTTSVRKRFGKLDKTEDGKLEISERNREKLSKKNIRGKRAINKVNKEYPESEISRLKIKGKVEAIDTFHEYEDEAGKTQLKVQSYNPKAKKVKAPIVKGLKKKNLYEWKDGKKVKVR